MNHLSKFKRDLAISLILAILFPGILSTLFFSVLYFRVGIEVFPSLILSFLLYLAAVVLSYYYLLTISVKPLEMIWQAVWHISPQKSSVLPPKVDSLQLGRELVSAVIMQIYNLASSNPSFAEKPQTPALNSDNLLDTIPLALFALDKDWTVRAANTGACNYLEMVKENIVGKNLYDVLHLSFGTDDTLDKWLKDTSQNRATDTHTWDHVRLSIDGKKTKQFDLAASFSKDSQSGNEVVLALFDRTSTYSVQDRATSYVALAVHELRTPLTMLRGYIELFEEELGSSLSPEHKEFMLKMNASAQSLAAFVNNVLNVARIDEDQFSLSLVEADWNEVLGRITDNLKLRAQVRNKKIQLNIEPNLPTVGIDEISMHEVVSNLVDNAIKYGGQSQDITINVSLNKEGLVETVVEDHGVGIPDNVMGGLFTKYYRSHRSKSAVGGSGLGLYLVKSIVIAHGGNVWVKSKEGEGSQFGFTIVPYANLDSDNKAPGQDSIERQASGWIKNHSLYRR